MNTFIRFQRSEQNQKTAPYTGEGAYHGASKARPQNPEEVEESCPTTVMRMLREGTGLFTSFDATFTNTFDVQRMLLVPSQEQIRDDGVTFCWCPFDEALREAGPVTKRVLLEMKPLLEGKKRHVYIDSKIQHFSVGDLPVDSKIWHVDGSITVRDRRAQELGHSIVHDMRARFDCAVPPPRYLAYQSSYNCATQYAVGPVTVKLPELIISFDILDSLVREADPCVMSQPAGSIVSFDGLSLHRAVPAQADEWRLWIRCIETDREVKLDSTIIECYNTVFKAR